MEVCSPGTDWKYVTTVQLVAWYWVGPQPEPMITKFLDTYIGHQGVLSNKHVILTV